MIPDEEIWLNMKGGDQNALQALYIRYQKMLFNFGQKITKDIQLNEDAIQDTFVSIWKYKNSLQTPQSIKQYLFKTFRNHLLGLINKSSDTRYQEEVFHFNFEIGFDHKMIEGEDTRIIADRIKKALEQLTDRQREIIYYRFFENLSFEEISEIMNMQVRATYKLTSRALASLREILGIHLFGILLSVFK